MDRNSAIGLTLIAALLMAYFYWFSPSPQPPTTDPTITQSSPVRTDTTAQAPVQNDSTLTASFGDLSAFAQGTETPVVVETQDLAIKFTNKGGLIRELELKKYKTYRQQPLKLISPDRTRFDLLAKYKGK